MYFLLIKDAYGMFSWSLKAANGETLADSNQAYKRRRDARIAIELIQSQVGGAQILEVAGERRKAIPRRQVAEKGEQAAPESGEESQGPGSPPPSDATASQSDQAAAQPE